MAGMILQTLESEIMLPGIWSLSPLAALTGGVVLLYWMIASGRLIPRASHERELKQANTRADEWKETSLSERQVNLELVSQNGMLLEAQRITDHFYQAVTPRVKTEGGEHVAT